MPRRTAELDEDLLADLLAGPTPTPCKFGAELLELSEGARNAVTQAYDAGRGVSVYEITRQLRAQGLARSTENTVQKHLQRRCSCPN